MIKFVTGNLLLLSFILSVFLHIGFFAGMQILNDNCDKEPVENTTLLYNVSLEYQDIQLQNHENTDHDNARKQGFREKKENGDIKKSDTSQKAEIPNNPPEPEILNENDVLLSNPLSGTFPYEQEDTKKKGTLTGFNTERNNAKKKDFIVKDLNNKIHKNFVYPPVAQRRGIEGTVKIFFIIDKQGKLIMSEIKKSSGHRILDKAALKVIDRVLPYPHTLDRPVEIKISIVYTLD